MYVCMYICSYVRTYMNQHTQRVRDVREVSFGATILPERYAIERLLDNQNECLGPDPRRGRVQIWENFFAGRSTRSRDSSDEEERRWEAKVVRTAIVTGRKKIK